MIKTSHSVRIPDDSNAVADAPTYGLYFEIQRGRTQFPCRPVRTGRFLIGNGAGCDLRLGGADVPPLHSIVHFEDGRFRLESVSATPLPTLEVNREPVTAAVLDDGDHVRIGSIEFVTRLALPESNTAAASRNGAVNSAESFDAECEGEFDASALGELTAEQLVDQINRDQSDVEDFEIRRELGGRALLHSAIRHAEGHEVDAFPLGDDVAGDELEILRRLEHAVERLSRCAYSLSTQADSTLNERRRLAAEIDSEPEPSRGPRSAA